MEGTQPDEKCVAQRLSQELKASLFLATVESVIKLEFILRLKIKRTYWLLADTCPQAANHFALF